MATIGIDIGGTKILGVRWETGGIAGKAFRETGDDPVSAASGVAAALLKDGPVSGIGLAVAAWVTFPEGTAVFAPNIQAEITSLSERFIADHGHRPIIENDATAAAWGEHSSGAAAGFSDVVVLTVGTGIGGGIISEGALLRGSRGFAGEFGHMTLDPSGPPCACGLNGCLEALASGSAIARLAASRLPQSTVLRDLAAGDVARVTGAMVSDAAAAGDEVSRWALEQVGRNLGVGIYSIAMALDPQLVVIGGGASEAGELLIGPARTEMENRFFGKASPPAVVAARLGNDAGAVGVAALVEERLEG